MSQPPIRLLIVDDVEYTRERLRALLSDISDIVVVGEASSGNEAIDQFDLLIPDAMTTCIHMPSRDGISATEEICKRHPDARIIICSVQDSTNHKLRASRAGAKEYLVKPPSVKEFVDAIRRAAGRETFESAKELQDLAKILNGQFSELKLSDDLLSKLPKSSWEARAQLRINQLEIDVVRNEGLLLADHRGPLSGELAWCEMIIPVVANTLSKHQNILSIGLTIRFSFRSENEEQVFGCNALALSSIADQISRHDGFGIMMSIMNPE